MVKGWRDVKVREALVDRIDQFIDDNDWGFASRTEVVAHALREFLERYERGKPLFQAKEDNDDNKEREARA